MYSLSVIFIHLHRVMHNDETSHFLIFCNKKKAVTLLPRIGCIGLHYFVYIINL